MHLRPGPALALLSAVLWASHVCAADALVIAAGMHHLRCGREREWDSFPERAETEQLVLRFNGSKNDAERTLRLRQRDVKQVWRVRLNDRDLGPLVQDENEIVAYVSVPAGTLRDGDNDLRIAADGGANVAADDV